MTPEQRLALLRHIDRRRRAGLSLVTEVLPTGTRHTTEELFANNWYCLDCNRSNLPSMKKCYGCDKYRWRPHSKRVRQFNNVYNKHKNIG